MPLYHLVLFFFSSLITLSLSQLTGVTASFSCFCPSNSIPHPTVRECVNGPGGGLAARQRQPTTVCGGLTLETMKKAKSVLLEIRTWYQLLPAMQLYLLLTYLYS